LWSAAPDLTTHGGHLIKEQQRKRAADIIPAKSQDLKTAFGAETGRALEAKGAPLPSPDGHEAIAAVFTRVKT
jgi:hypothetical protein